jgi:hypothetical protein
MNTPRNKLKQVQQQADIVTIVLRDNIELSIANQEKLKDVEEKAEALERDAGQFYVGSRRIRRIMCFRSCKITFLSILTFVILALIIILPVTLRR